MAAIRVAHKTRRHPTDVQHLFKKTLLEATDFPEGGGVIFSSGDFFRSWFREHGCAYYFLFKKNLAVTNIQFAELVALIRSLTIDDGDRETDLQFFSHQEFTDSLRELVDTFSPQTREEASAAYSTTSELYSDILRNMVVIDAYYGSCSLFLPANLHVSLSKICGYSGYIHSCGRNVYVRNVNKADYAYFAGALDRYIDRFYPGEGKLFFTTLAEEDSPGDKEMGRVSELVHGIADTKVHVERFYMGGDRLVEVLKMLSEHPKLGSRLEIPPPGDFRETHPEAPGRINTIWLLKDYTIGKGGDGHRDEIFYICYDQLFKNANPFHIFDENKPAWVAHTTTPHMLIGAMLNVTRPGWPERPKICDPFAGTGTSALEAIKFDDCEVSIRDSSKVSEIICQDNAEVFGASAEKLSEMENLLDKFLSSSPLAVIGDNSSQILKIFLMVQEDIVAFTSREGEIKVVNEEEFAATMSARTFDERFITYVALRAVRRNEGAQLRGTFDWKEAFRKEAVRLKREVQMLRLLREKDALPTRDGIAIVQTRYSGGCTIRPEEIVSRWSRQISFAIKRVEELEPEAFDVIVADPPYGFNTEEDRAILARLYSAMIPRMVRALRPNGQLVITLPERSYIGRRSPYFTHKEIVTQQVLHAAREVNSEIVTASVPEPTRLYKPPYYWRSEKALARTILHFRLMKREGMREEVK